MLGKRSDQKGLGEADRLYLDYVGQDTFYGLLASLRGQLFSDDDFAEIYCPDNGRDSVPPSLLATALLLQTYDKVSDAEANRKLRRKVPSVDGALTTQPMAWAVPPVRSASASSMQSPPASAEATSVSSLSPGLARPGASPRSTWLSTSVRRPRCCQGDGQDQAGIVHQSVVVEGDLDAVEVAGW